MRQPPHEATDSDSDLDLPQLPGTTLLLALINHPQRHTNARIRSLANQIIHQATYTDIPHNSYTLAIPNQLTHDNTRTLINLATDAINNNNNYSDNNNNKNSKYNHNDDNKTTTTMTITTTLTIIVAHKSNKNNYHNNNGENFWPGSQGCQQELQ